MSQLRWYKYIIISAPLLTLIIELAALISSIITIYQFHQEILLFQEYHMFTIPAILFIISLSRFIQFFIQHEIHWQPSSRITIIFGILTTLNILILFNESMMLETVTANINATNHKAYVLKNSMKHFNDDTDIRFLWNSIQTKYECCGYDSCKDWTIIPRTCFRCHIPGTLYVRYREGCGKIVTEKLRKVLVESNEMLTRILSYEILIMLGIGVVWIFAFINFIYSYLCVITPRSGQVIRRGNSTERTARDLPPPYSQHI